MSANDKQVGGKHYKNDNGLPDHWDIVMGMGWDYLVGNATKYIWRLGRKGGPEKSIEDLDKAMHYLAKKRELLVAEVAKDSQSVPVDNVTTLGDIIRKKIQDEGLGPNSSYTNQG